MCFVSCIVVYYIFLNEKWLTDDAMILLLWIFPHVLCQLNFRTPDEIFGVILNDQACACFCMRSFSRALVLGCAHSDSNFSNEPVRLTTGPFESTRLNSDNTLIRLSDMIKYHQKWCHMVRKGKTYHINIINTHKNLKKAKFWLNSPKLDPWRFKRTGPRKF